MDELMLEPDPEKRSLHNNTGEEDASELFTFSEVKTGLAVIKLEPEGERDPELDGTIDPEPDDEIDPLALNSEGGERIVEREDLLCPLAFLAVESKAVDGMWDSTAVSMKVEVDGETRDEEYEVHLEELNGVRKMTWNGMEVKERRGRPKNHVHVSEEEKLARQRERNRLCKRCSRASKSQEATSRERERNRLYMRKFRASLRNELERDRDKAHKHMAFMFVTPELSELCGEDDVEMWHERNRKARRKPIIALIPQQLEWQREQKRIYIMKFRASLSDEELERRREKDRLLKRRAKEIMKERKQDITFQGGSQAQHHILQNRNFWNYAALAKEQNLLI